MRAVQELGSRYRPVTLTGFSRPEGEVTLPAPDDTCWTYSRLGPSSLARLHQAMKPIVRASGSPPRILTSGLMPPPPSFTAPFTSDPSRHCATELSEWHAALAEVEAATAAPHAPEQRTPRISVSGNAIRPTSSRPTSGHIAMPLSLADHSDNSILAGTGAEQQIHEAPFLNSPPEEEEALHTVHEASAVPHLIAETEGPDLSAVVGKEPGLDADNVAVTGPEPAVAPSTTPAAASSGRYADIEASSAGQLDDDDGGFVQEDDDVGSGAEDEVEAAISRVSQANAQHMPKSMRAEPAPAEVQQPTVPDTAEQPAAANDNDDPRSPLGLSQQPDGGEDGSDAALARCEMMQEEVSEAAESPAVEPEVAPENEQLELEIKAAHLAPLQEVPVAAGPAGGIDTAEDLAVIADDGEGGGLQSLLNEGSALARPPSSSSGNRPTSARPTSARPGGRPTSARVSSANQRSSTMGAIIETVAE